MDRPATIKNLQKPDDVFLAYCLTCNYRVVQFIDKNWLTLSLLQELIKGMESEKSSYSYEHLLRNFNKDILNSLPEVLIQELYKKHPELIIHFPAAPYELFLDVVNKRKLNYTDIPIPYRTDKLLAKLFASHTYNFPVEALTGEIIDLALDDNSDCINQTPEKLVTTERLAKALQKTPDLTLTRSLPYSAWNQELADAAIEGDNFRFIPPQFKTKEMCLRIISHNYPLNLIDIPSNLLDESLLLTILSHQDCSQVNNIPKKYLKKSFLLKLAEKDAQSEFTTCYGIKNYIAATEFLKPEDWVEVMKICPKALKLIPKENQTDTIIDTFFQNASIEIIDKLHQHINLIRIKKNHAPYMVGSTIKCFQDIITRKMIKKPRRNLSKEVQAIEAGTKPPDADTVCVYLTDSEYLDITKKFGQ